MSTDLSFAQKFEYSDNQSNAAKLSAGRVLGILDDHYAAAYRLKNVLKTGQFKLHSYRFYQTFVYFGFSKNQYPNRCWPVFSGPTTLSIKTGYYWKFKRSINRLINIVKYMPHQSASLSSRKTVF